MILDIPSFCKSCVLIALLGITPLWAEQTSGIKLSPDETIVCAVNQDADSISIWNWQGDGSIRQIMVGQEPRTLAFSPDGRYVYVTNQRSQTVAVVELGSGAVAKEIAVGGQPYGITVSSDGRLAFVSQYAGGYIDGVYQPGMVTILDMQSYEPVAKIPVKARPWAMAMNADRTSLYVTHYLNLGNNGVVTEIDLQQRRVVREITLREDDHVRDGQGGVFNALAAIAMHPNGGRALVAGMHANVRRGKSLNDQPLSHKTTVQATVRVIDLASGCERYEARINSSFNGQAVAVPSAISFIGDSPYYIDVYFASNDFKVIQYNEQGVVAERALRALPAGPTGVAVTRDGKNAFFCNRWDRSISHFSLADPRNPMLVKTISSCKEPWSPDILQGAKLFHNTRDGRMTANRWMSCGVCHLDGGVISDGLVWDLTTPENHSKIGNTMDLVNTPGASPPFFHRGELNAFEALERFVLYFQQGSGFSTGSPDSKTVSPEWKTMQAYMNSLQARPNPHMEGDRPRPEIRAEAERGARLFFDATIGCSHCHNGAALTVAGRKGRLSSFDVGTGTTVKTPSLLNLWDTAPYLHDGRAATLHDVLTTHNPQDCHGKTSHLSNEQLHDLETFLLAPYITESP
jgi:YVTN family beta-propeller protein